VRIKSRGGGDEREDEGTTDAKLSVISVTGMIDKGVSSKKSSSPLVQTEDRWFGGKESRRGERPRWYSTRVFGIEVQLVVGYLKEHGDIFARKGAS